MRLKAGATRTTSTWSRDFQIWSSATKGREWKEKTHLPSHGFVKQHPGSWRAASKLRLLKEDLNSWHGTQLWSYWVHLPPAQPLLSSLGENTTRWWGLLSGGSKAAYPLIRSSCGHTPTCARIALGFRQSPGRGTDFVPNHQTKSALWGFVGLELGIGAPSLQWELGSGMWAHRLLLPADDSLQNRGEGDSYGLCLALVFLTLSMRMLVCNMFSLNILLSVALVIHLLVITVPISKYREINKNT